MSGCISYDVKSLSGMPVSGAATSSTLDDLHSLKNGLAAPTVPIEGEGFRPKAW